MPKRDVGPGEVDAYITGNYGEDRVGPEPKSDLLKYAPQDLIECLGEEEWFSWLREELNANQIVDYQVEGIDKSSGLHNPELMLLIRVWYHSEWEG